MAKTKTIINRDTLIKASRLELRLTKVQKDELTAKAKNEGLTLTDFVLKKCGLSLPPK
ncbi:MAG: DUF1778 domain-containing protein [Bacteroidota bacterium]|jgi:uncharacterized protein (DUF1778 family)